jgi:hypothetical protein
VGHFLAAQEAPTGSNPSSKSPGIGDPAFSIAVPRSQWRNCHVFTTPDGFASNYLSIAAPASAQVKVDGKLLGQGYWKTLGKNARWTRIFVAPGTHEVDGTEAVSVEVYGWDQYIGYAYPAGMKLKDLGMATGP